MKITDLFVPFPDELQLLPSARVADPPLIEWTSAWGDLFFRPKNADPQIVWCVLGRGAPDKRPLSKQRLETLNKYVSQAFAGRTFFRVMPFSDGDDWALVRPKRALVKSPVQKKGAIWKWPADFPIEKTQLDWLSQPLTWFKNLLSDNANEGLEDARELAQMSDDEREWWPLSREAGLPEQCEGLVLALQRLCCPIEQSSLSWHMSIQDRGIYFHPHESSKGYFSEPPIQNLLDILKSILPNNFHRPHFYVVDRRGQKFSHIWPSFFTASPSRHERLEAALLWRDFGRSIGESARVEAALSELLAGE